MIQWLMMLAGLIAAYLMLQQGSQLLGSWGSQLAAVMLLLSFFVAGLRWTKIKYANRAQSQRSLRSSDVIAGMVTLMAFASFLLLYFLHTPALMNRAADSLLTRFIPESTVQASQLENLTAQGKSSSGNWLWNEHNIRPLPRRAHLRPGNIPEVFIQLDDAADAKKLLAKRAYVSAFALGTYRDSAWMLTPANASSMPVFPDRPGDIIAYQIFHPADPTGQTPLTALQGLRETSIAPLSYRGDGVALLPAMNAMAGYRYQAASQPLLIDDLPDDARAMPAARVPSPWLALPSTETLVIGIRGLNAEAVSQGTLRRQLQQIRDSLRQECSYSLDIYNPENHDPLENFLFHEKSGHCEMFATAGVMCARALGVPARIAYGWCGGSYYESSNLFVFRSREAHAWTEVLIEGIGWVVMDCTPRSAIGRSRAAAPEEKPLNDKELAALTPEPEAQTTDLARLSTGLGICGSACLLIAVAILLIRQRGETSNHSSSRSGAKPPSYLQQFHQYCRSKKLHVSPGSTLRHLLRALPSRPPFAEELQRYHCRTQYGNQAPDQETEKRLSEKIRRAREQEL